MREQTDPEKLSENRWVGVGDIEQEVCGFNEDGVRN